MKNMDSEWLYWHGNETAHTVNYLVIWLLMQLMFSPQEIIRYKIVDSNSRYLKQSMVTIHCPFSIVVDEALSSLIIYRRVIWPCMLYIPKYVCV